MIAYINEGKIEIIPMTNSDSLNETKINKTTLEHSIKSNKKVYFKSPSHTSKKIKTLAIMVLGTMVPSFNTVIDIHTLNPIGIMNEIPGPIHYTYVLEKKLGILDELGKDKDPSNCPLLSHANLTMKKKLQFMDTINDEEDEDTSFVPSTILDHRIMKTPCCENHKSTDKNSKKFTYIKIVRESHLGIQLEWKNGEISWCATNSLKEQNPFIFLPYFMKRKLSNHPHFEWVMKYAKEKDNVTRLFQAYATRMKKSSKEPKFKFGIQVPHN